MINSKNFITIQGWMTKLNLSSSELIIYAIIYGFSQDNQSWFYGSIDYLKDWCGLSRVSVSNNLQKLVDKKLLDKKERPGDTSLYRIHQNLEKLSDVDSDETIDFEFDNFKCKLSDNEPEKLTEDELFEKEKNKKDLRTLMRWTGNFISNDDLKEALINWLKIMQVNGKYQTLSLYRDKLQYLLNNTSSDEDAISIVKDTTDKGYYSFKFSLEKLNKQNKSNDGLYNPYRGS